MVRYVIDTGVFFRPSALTQLAKARVPVIIPSVVYMERARQLSKKGVDLQEFDNALLEGGFVVEPFGPEEARRYAVHIHDDHAWRKIFRDAMIAGHVGPGDVLWTTNPKDFARIGLEADAVNPV